MAIFHLSVKTIGRSAGRSATAAAAYRAGARVPDERTGLVHDYSRKRGVEHTQIFLPENAPEWAADRVRLWNAAELAETRKNSTVAREFEVALPTELNRMQRLALVREFAGDLVKEHGMAVDVAVHEPGKEGDCRNHHAHILCSTRRLTGDGFKDKTRELDDQKSGAVTTWRQRWAELSNRHFEAAGREERVDHRSLAAQHMDAVARGDQEAAAQLNRTPTIHLGPNVAQMERQGLTTDRGKSIRQLEPEAEIRSLPAADIVTLKPASDRLRDDAASTQILQSDLADSNERPRAEREAAPAAPRVSGAARRLSGERTAGNQKEKVLYRLAAISLSSPKRRRQRVESETGARDDAPRSSATRPESRSKIIRRVKSQFEQRAMTGQHQARQAGEKPQPRLAERAPLGAASKEMLRLFKDLEMPDGVKKLFAARLTAHARDRHLAAKHARREIGERISHQRTLSAVTRGDTRGERVLKTEAFLEKVNAVPARDRDDSSQRTPARPSAHGDAGESDIDPAIAARRRQILERFKEKAARDRVEERERGR